MSKNEKKTVLTILYIIIINVATKLLGFVRDAYIGQTYAKMPELDTYFVSLNLTTLTFLSLGSAIVISTIPIIINAKNSENYDKILSSILTYLISLSCIGILIYFIFSGFIANVLASGFNTELRAVTASNIIVLSITLLFICITYFNIALLQSNEHFKLPAMISIPYNLLIIGFIYFYGSTKGVASLVAITSFGWFLQMAITIPTTVKVAKFKFRPTLKNVDGQVYKMLFGLAPVVLVYLTTQANITIANYFLTRFEGGSVTAFYYAQMLFIAIVTIIVYAISAVMFPKFNKTIKDNRVEFFSNLSQVAQSIIVLMLPITICLILFSQPIVEIIFLRGDFTIDNAQLTANLLKILSIYMIAYGFLDVLNRGYFTLDDKKTPIVATCTILASSFVLNFIFVNILNLEVYSIALSTVIAYFIGALVSALLFSKKYGNLGIRKIIKSFLKALVACIAMFSIYLILHSAFGDEFSKVNIFAKLIVLCIEGVSVMLAYVGVLLLLKEKNLYEFISKAKNKNEKQ